MKKHNFKLFGIFLLLATTSCDKFIEVQPKGYTIPTTYEDFDLLLNNSNLTSISNLNMVELTDDVDRIAISGQETDVQTRTYLWADQAILDVTTNPPFWSEGYRNIYYYNVVLDGISASDTVAQAKQLRAEALFGRAFEYFYLINLYAKEYSPETAATDLGVPFVTSVSVDDEIPGRGTVKSVYDQLVEDVTTALPSLPDVSVHKYRPSKKAAYSLLANLYLHMNEYDLAAENAALAAEGMGRWNIRSLGTGIYYPDAQVNTLFARISSVQYNTVYPVSEELFYLHETGDARRRYSYRNLNASGRGTHDFVMNNLTSGYRLIRNLGTTTEEMRLIMAEVTARNGDPASALAYVNDVRQWFRISSGYAPLTIPSNLDEEGRKAWVLARIFEERRREFAFTGKRWFDMRRLDEEGLMPTVARTMLNGEPYSSPDGGPAQLVPGSPKYVLQIPQKVSYFNPSLPLNPR